MTMTKHPVKFKLIAHNKKEGITRHYDAKEMCHLMQLIEVELFNTHHGELDRKVSHLKSKRPTNFLNLAKQALALPKHAQVILGRYSDQLKFAQSGYTFFNIPRNAFTWKSNLGFVIGLIIHSGIDTISIVSRLPSSFIDNFNNPEITIEQLFKQLDAQQNPLLYAHHQPSYFCLELLIFRLAGFRIINGNPLSTLHRSHFVSLKNLAGQPFFNKINQIGFQHDEIQPTSLTYLSVGTGKKGAI